MLRSEIEQVRTIATEVCKAMIKEAFEELRAELAKRPVQVVKEKPYIQK